MKAAKVSGVELSYVEKGTGTPLVLVHGSLNDYRAWALQLEPFAERFHVVAYSRRNHYPNAWSEYPPGFSVADERDDLVGLVGALGLKAPVHVVGSSYGAYIAALVERDCPDVVRSAVLGEPPILSLLADDPKSLKSYRASEGKFAEMVLAHLRDGDDAEAAKGFIDFTMSAGAFDRLPAEAREMMLQNSKTLAAELPTPERDHFTTEDARKISAPTLLLRGQRSPLMFQAVTSILAKSMPNATVSTIRDSSHAPHSTHVALYNKTVLRFLLDN
ncbi:MAG: alpha/beta hydrolase [Thaumarchaeota archaeon]|nr:alpha/beta hydrolase [Nitrososphaerota archaeon]